MRQKSFAFSGIQPLDRPVPLPSPYTDSAIPLLVTLSANVEIRQTRNSKCGQMDVWGQYWCELYVGTATVAGRLSIPSLMQELICGVGGM